jgi:signal recognition particle subunit SRP54
LAVSCDVYRPAAIEQLKTVSAQAGIDFFPSAAGQKPADIAAAALDYARKHYFDVLFVDTAGRLAIDAAMMAEIKELHAQLNPIECLFVVDAMLGQDAVNTAKAFNEALPLTGVVLTKLDGDARGGAALSVRHVTGKPIKFAGTGEKLDAIEPFQPSRVAGRILGMGDVVSIVEKAAAAIEQEDAERMAERMAKGQFDMNDLRQQLRQMQKMGGLGALAGMMPGMKKAKAAMQQSGMDDKVLLRMDAIIGSMTPRERTKPELLNAKRKIRIANGSGVQVQDVNKLLKMHQEMERAMKQIKKMGGLKGLGALFGKGGLGAAMPGLGGGAGGGGLPGLGSGGLPSNLNDLLKK